MPEQEPQPSSAKLPILIVDDDPAVRDLLETLLQTEGYQTITAESGEEAVEIFLADLDTRYALIMADLLMPGLNGKETIQEIRKTETQLQRPEFTPFVFITAVAPQNMPDLSCFKPPPAVIRKPFEIETILEIAHHQAKPSKTSY